ncbi:MAG: hypothetical protein MUC86_12200 [Burkholderiaceae bacterium]|jgi:hypothetical protein|nr:hypothetical protein [Burkholderiaceae bacterium]
MKRWFIARMGDYDGSGDRMPAVAQYITPGNPINYRVWSSDADDWAIGELAARNIGQLQADPDVALFPDAMLFDFRWDVFPPGIRTALVNRLQAAGFTTGAIGPNWANRDLLAYLVGQRQAGIDIDIGHVSDV